MMPATWNASRKRPAKPEALNCSTNHEAADYPGLIVNDSDWRWPERDTAANAIDFCIKIPAPVDLRRHARDQLEEKIEKVGMTTFLPLDQVP